jgi:hypothetical protein
VTESKYRWSDLSTNQLGRYAEYFIKMEFTLHGFDVYTAEVDNKGIDFLVRTGGEDVRYYDVQVKSARNLSYIFFRKEYFDACRANLLAAVVLFCDGEAPQPYLIPATTWLKPIRPFVDRPYDKGQSSPPEWGLNLTARTLAALQPFAFEETVAQLR